MIKELRTFLAVGRCGTFSQAGARMGLTQSAVSAQIQRLEASLGFALFDRVGRTARLNDAGQGILARAEALVAAFDGLRQPSPPVLPPLLRVGAIASVQAHALPGALMAMRRAYPLLRMRVVPGVSLVLLGQVDAGELDAAVMIRPNFALPREIAWRPLWSEPFVLAVPARVRGADWRAILGREPFLRYDRGSFGGRLVEQFLEAEAIAVDDVVEMDEIAGLIHAVARGAGVAIVPRCAPYFPLPAGVRAVRLDRPGMQRDIGLIERRRHAQTAVVDTLYGALLPR